MIDINLIPVAQRKKSGGMLGGTSVGIPQEILWGGIGGCAVLLVAVHIALLGMLGIKQTILASYKSEGQKLLPDKKRIEDMTVQVKDLKAKMTSITQATSRKVTAWSYKLNVISDAVPKGLWIKKIGIDGTALMIEGSVVSKNQSEVVIVGSFVSGLKKDDMFMNDLEGLEVNSIVRNKRGGTEVANFTVMAKLKLNQNER